MSDTRPSIPPTSDTSTKETLGSRLKTAGLLAAKQAQRTKLVTLTLPNNYRELGKHLYKGRAFTEELADVYGELDLLSKEMKTIKAQAAQRTTPEGLAGKAKAAATTAKEATQTKALEFKARGLLAKLGEAAFNRLGKQAGPIELLQPIANGHNELSALDAEIANLSEAKSGTWFTPKRMVWTGAIVGGIWIIGAIGSIVAPTKHREGSPQESNAAANNENGQAKGPNQSVAGNKPTASKYSWSKPSEATLSEPNNALSDTADETRKRMTAKHQGFDLKMLHDKFGKPDLVWKHPVKPNLQIWGWRMGSIEQDMWLVKVIFFRIDGGGPESLNLSMGEPVCLSEYRLSKLEASLAAEK